jgi:nitrogen regulatory protein P-II 1
MMKLVKCIVRTLKADDIADALRAIDVSGVTVTDVRGRGRKKLTLVYRGREQEARFLPQTMIDVVVPDYLVDDVVRIVMDTAHTGQMGDGRIFVLPIEESYTIRTRTGGFD